VKSPRGAVKPGAPVADNVMARGEESGTFPDATQRSPSHPCVGPAEGVRAEAVAHQQTAPTRAPFLGPLEPERDRASRELAP
jgi:hypothetical protein